MLPVIAFYWYYLYRTKFAQRTFYFAQLIFYFRNIALLASSYWLLGCRRQIDIALAIQSQKGNATAHLFQIAVGTPPVKPRTDILRQLPPRNSGLVVNGCLNFIDNFRRKYLTTDIHAGNLINNPPCVQRKMWDRGSFRRGARGEIQLVNHIV